MNLRRFLLPLALFASTVSLSHAQLQPNWLPPSIAALAQTASSKTEFTLDHQMLIFASKLDSGNDDLRRVIAGVSGISIHSFHYPAAWDYNPEDLGSVKREYHSAGWQQLVNSHAKNGGPGVTDLWVHLANNAVSDIAILVARPNDVSFVVVSGSISPLDLLRLGGHFGIPKIEGGVEIPNSAPAPARTDETQDR